jgi:uncharacterized protein (TIGR03905 family)
MSVHIYKTKGTCSREMKITYEGDQIIDVQIIGGCNGNLQGISSLVKGMKFDDVVNKLEGIRCGFRPTSCPDQLATAIKEIKDKENL